MLVQFLPLVVAVGLLSVVGLSRVSPTVDAFLSRVAIRLFGRYVRRESPRRAGQVAKLRAARVPTSHRLYAARTILFAGVFGVAGGILGVYAAGLVLLLLQVDAATIEAVLPRSFFFLANVARLPSLSLTGIFTLVSLGSLTVGAGLALVTYWARWEWLSQRANARGSKLEATLPRTVAFIYALSRSGMPFPEVLETLSRHEEVYGEAAREVGIVVRETEAFGTDVVTALQRMSEHTPSQGIEEFSDNLASVLGSGRSLSEFLREQYERYQQEARSRQEQYLDLLATFAEVYVTLLVAGPLFLITLFVIIGLVLVNTLPAVAFIGYVGIPLVTVGFVVYVDSMTGVLPGKLDAPERDPAGSGRGDPRLFDRDVRPTAEPDGGAVGAVDRGIIDQIDVYRRIRRVRGWVTAPVATAISRPALTTLVTVPIAVAWFVVRSVPIPLGLSAVEAIDGPLVESTVFVLGVFAVAHEAQSRRAAAIDRAVPDLLDRMASVNEAGLSVVESLERVTDGELGKLGPELERTWRDFRWGADVVTAFQRLDGRTQSVAVSQTTTLITNAMRASGDLAPVLRIAATEAQEDRRLRRERKQVMLTYLLVIYVSFFVFLGIIVALSIFFLPAVESAGSGGGGALGQAQLSSIGGVNTDAYRLLFFHTAAIQAVCSGTVAGQLGEGEVSDGVKHATALLTIAYLVFLFI